MSPVEKLKAWRAVTDRSQADLASEVKCHHATIARIEKGDAFPSRSVANAIEKLTAGHELGAILASEWDELEVAAKAAKAQPGA